MVREIALYGVCKGLKGCFVFVLDVTYIIDFYSLFHIHNILQSYEVQNS